MERERWSVKRSDEGVQHPALGSSPMEWRAFVLRTSPFSTLHASPSTLNALLDPSDRYGRIASAFAMLCQRMHHALSVLSRR